MQVCWGMYVLGFMWVIPGIDPKAQIPILGFLALFSEQPWKEGEHAPMKYVVAGLHMHLEVSQTPWAVLSKPGIVQVSHAPIVPLKKLLALGWSVEELCIPMLLRLVLNLINFNKSVYVIMLLYLVVLMTARTVNELNISGCFIDIELLFRCSWSKSETFHGRMRYAFK